MRIVYASDLHGNTSHYDELLGLASSEHAQALVLGGDLLPSPHGLSSPAGRADSHERQLGYLLSELLPRLEMLQINAVGVFLLLGNYDMGSVAGPFEAECASRGFLTLHDQVRESQGEFFAGLTSVNFTPFPLKDWETYDLEEGDVGAGAADQHDPRAVFTVERADGFVPLAATLERLGRKVPSRAGEATYVLHAPPHGCGLDLVSRRDPPVGSRAVRRFIETAQPRLTLHGHIHESPHLSGRWAARLGQTLAIQPGQAVDRLHAVVVDTLHPLETARHTIFGPLDPQQLGS